MNLLVALLLLAPKPTAKPAPPPAPPPQHWLVILGGGRTEAPAQFALDEVRRDLPAFLELAEGFPALRRSDDLRGLGPGFVLAVAGACATEAEANRARGLLSFLLPHAYVRPVHATSVALSCPTVKAKGSPLEATFAPLADGLSLGAASASTDCKATKVTLQLRAHDVPVDELALEGRCEKACEVGGPTGTRCVEKTVSYRVVDTQVLSPRLAVRVRRVDSGPPRRASTEHWYGFSCGGLREVLELPTPEGELALRLSGPVGHPWRSIEPSVGGVSQGTWGWVPQACRYLPNR